MALVIERVDVLGDKRAKNRFIDLQWEIYKNDPNWVPLLKMELKKMFDKKHAFYPTANVEFWIAVKDGKDVGRIMAIVNKKYNEFHNEKTGHYGFFEAIDERLVFESLFDTASAWLKSQDMESIQGPFNPSSNYESGNLIVGNDQQPVLMMTYNPNYYQAHIEELGFNTAKDLLAYQLKAGFKMPELIKRVAARAEKSNGITYRTIKKKDWVKEVALMYEIYNDAWEDNWGFVPMTKDEFYTMGADLKAIADENLILFSLIDGEAAGFIVALPDFNQVLHKIPSGKIFPTGIFKLLRAKKYMTGVRIPTMGVKKKFRHLGLGAILYHRCYENILKYPQYKDIEMSWILEDNFNMNKPLLRMNAVPYRKYRIFERKL